MSREEVPELWRFGFPPVRPGRSIDFVDRKLEVARSDGPAPRTRGKTMEPAGTEPPSSRRRIGFSEIPRKVRRIVLANVLGGAGLGYLYGFLRAYLPPDPKSTRLDSLHPAISNDRFFL